MVNAFSTVSLTPSTEYARTGDFVLFVATLLSYAIGIVCGAPVLVPILNTLASYPFMILALKRGDLRLAVVRMQLVQQLAAAGIGQCLEQQVVIGSVLRHRNRQVVTCLIIGKKLLACQAPAMPPADRPAAAGLRLS